MLSKSQAWTLDAGQTAHLECEFIADDFNLFDNPIIWRKRQQLRRRRPHPGDPDVQGSSAATVQGVAGHDEEEETQINMMGNLVEPFISAQRFRPTFHDQRGSSYIFGLTVSSKQLPRTINVVRYFSLCLVDKQVRTRPGGRCDKHLTL